MGNVAHTPASTAGNGSRKRKLPMPAKMPAGYTQLPNTLLYDERLPWAVLRTWAWLLHFAWRYRADRQLKAKDLIGLPVHLPPMDVIAARAGMTRRNLLRHIEILRELGYIQTARPSRREALIYRIWTSPQPPEQAAYEAEVVAAIGNASSDRPVTTPDVPYARAALQEEQEKSLREDVCYAETSRREVDWQLAGEPPKLSRSPDGPVALEAIAEECQIAVGSPHLAECAVALHGRKDRLATNPGVNRLYWLSVALSHDLTLRDVRAQAAENPGRYHQALAAEVRRKATLYRERMPKGAALTPMALAKWWADLDGLPERGRGGGLSAVEIETLP